MDEELTEFGRLLEKLAAQRGLTLEEAREVIIDMGGSEEEFDHWVYAKNWPAGASSSEN
jgi:hypothetical protein